MKRLAFNGGEVSGALALRSDLDVYARACSCVENFDISQMGGVKRRRGMRFFANGEKGSKLFGYEYTVEERFLIELSKERIRVYAPDGRKEFEGAAKYKEPLRVSATQINALMIFAAGDCPLMELKRGGDGRWSWQEYKFKHAPQRHNNYRDSNVTVTKRNGAWSVAWESSEEASERQALDGDELRASVWTEQAEASAYASSLLRGVSTYKQLSNAVSLYRGEKIAVRGEGTVRYYSCVEDWEGSSAFVEGLSHPGNYSGCFVQSEAVSGAKDKSPITALTKSMSFKKGEILAIETAYWHYYTVTKDFVGSKDFVQGRTSPDDYGGYFVRGLEVGDAVQSKGQWKFVCSGGWIGEYEVRRCYKGSGLTEGEWEVCGTSVSPMGGTLNTAITGDESEEECWLRLFITKSYRVGDDPVDGFPLDSCENKLVVSSYKHDITLRCKVAAGGGVSWESTEAVALPITDGTFTTRDWSWAAFSARYGYASLVELHSMRLVLAGTAAQPLTIWMSKTDDLDNFAIGKTDDSALALTMAGKTQNPICWMLSRSERLLLGTTNAEYVVTAGGGGAITAGNAQVGNHGWVGSASVGALNASDKALYCERGGGRVYQYGYDYESDGFISRDLTVFADHVLADGGGAVDSCFVRKPDAKAVFVRADGQVAIMTYNSLHQVNAWHRYVTDGRVTSCAMLPNGNKADSLFFLVERGSGCAIEVIDEQSGYVDNGGRGYVSKVVTTALTVAEGREARGSKPKIYFYLGEETEVEGIEVSTDGVVWRRLDRNERMLGAGWHELVADVGVSWEQVLGVRVSGDRGINILAMQS